MFGEFKEQLRDAIAESVKGFFAEPAAVPVVEVEVPADKSHGEFSTNIALKSTKALKRPPLDLAAQFLEAIQKNLMQSSLDTRVERIDIQKPGFINFYLTRNAVYDVLYQVHREQDNYGRSDFGQGKKIQIEFVSANPTGPLSVAHARQAAVGDALGNIFNFIGFQTTKEYYVNDEGNQINILGRSIHDRAVERLGGSVQFAEDGYQGEYIYGIADSFIEKHNVKSLEDMERHGPAEFSRFGVDSLMAVIRKELEDFGVRFDVWSYQSEVASDEKVHQGLKELQAQGHIYEQDGAMWFKTTVYGDDKDRVVRKSDGSYTYFMPDIVYHKNKFSRGYEKVFNIWGPDHHGYIPRLRAAVQALGQKPDALQVLIVQLATLFREGKPVQMSTRRGQYITLREVIEEVGVDAARFFFLMRLIDAHLEFDLELAKKETPENPVYYIQYAHARICSMLEKACESGIDVDSDPMPTFKHLKEDEELDLIKKIGHFPGILLTCWNQADAFALVNYLQELAAMFHRFYDRHRVVDLQNKELSTERSFLSNAVRIVLANGLRLLGVTAPQEMENTIRI